METNTETVKRPLWKEVNDELRTRATRVFELIDSLENVIVDEWEKRRLAEVRDHVDDTIRIYGWPTIRMKIGFGTVRITTSANAARDRGGSKRLPDGSLAGDWSVTTNVEIELGTSMKHDALAAQLVKLSALVGALAVAFQPVTIVVVEETADEAAARIAAEKAERERNAKNKILTSAITLAGRGMRITSQPRAIPLQILEGVPEGSHTIDLAGKSYTVRIGPKTATLDRTR